MGKPNAIHTAFPFVSNCKRRAPGEVKHLSNQRKRKRIFRFTFSRTSTLRGNEKRIYSLSSGERKGISPNLYCEVIVSMEILVSVYKRWRKLEGVAVEGVVRHRVRPLPRAGDETCVLYSKICWKAEPKKVIALYAKYIHTITSMNLEYCGTREIL